MSEQELEPLPRHASCVAGHRTGIPGVSLLCTGAGISVLLEETQFFAGCEATSRGSRQGPPETLSHNL